MKNRKGFTLTELMVVIAISGWVLATVMLTYNTITKNTAKKRAQSETEEYLNMLNLSFQRTFGSMSAVQLSSTTTAALTISTAGWFNNTKVTSYSFSQGSAVLDPPITSSTITTSKFGEVLPLFVFKFDNPLLDKGVSSIDAYRVMCISFTNNGVLTQKSNFVYLEYDNSTSPAQLIAQKELAYKPDRLTLRTIRIGPSSNNGIVNKKLLDISIGVRDYLNRAKFREDQMTHKDPYNYETTKLFTLLIRSQ